MNAPFMVDGVAYDVIVPDGELKRNATIKDGDNAGVTKSGDTRRDILGTYFNYSLTIDTRNMSVEAYDSLYQVLTAPVDNHTVVFPYGQTTLSFVANIYSVDDEVRTIDGGTTYWHGMTLTFTAQGPQRRPT